MKTRDKLQNLMALYSMGTTDDDARTFALLAIADALQGIEETANRVVVALDAIEVAK